MIFKFSVYLTQKLTKKGNIELEEKELYEYAFFMIFSYSFFLIFTLVIGLLAKIPVESVSFFIIFSVIRNYAGGIHANTETKCAIFTSVSIVLCVLLLKFMTCFKLNILSLVLMLVAIICLCFIKPIDNLNKELSNVEKKHNHKIVIGIMAVIVFLYFILFFIEKQSIAFSFSVSVILAAILLTAGKIQNFKKNCKKNSAI